MAVLALVYYLFPNTDQPFRYITSGAVLAVIVALSASLGFSYYVSNIATYSATYSSLGAAIVLLLYLFISAAVLLLGAEVSPVVYRQITRGENGMACSDRPALSEPASTPTRLYDAPGAYRRSARVALLPPLHGLPNRESTATRPCPARRGGLHRLSGPCTSRTGRY
ncbi:MAG: YihY/virulence factor BrkB family protein [Actinomycetota bacterium]|nr:YihY/virulence factor BrkB family protein [Actinomycetota bacterium]